MKQGNSYLPTELALQSAAFKKWAEDEGKKKTVYDAKRSEVALRRHDIHLKGVDFDILIASYLINPTETIEDLSAIAKKYEVQNIQSDESFYGKGVKRKVPETPKLAEHLVRKSLAMLGLKRKTGRRFKTE